MKARLKRTGGFTGIPVTLALEAEDISPSHQALLHRLLEQQEAAATPAEPAGMHRARDAFDYLLHIEDGGRSANLAFDDATMPDELAEVIAAFLENGQRINPVQ